MDKTGHKNILWAQLPSVTKQSNQGVTVTAQLLTKMHDNKFINSYPNTTNSQHLCQKILELLFGSPFPVLEVEKHMHVNANYFSSKKILSLVIIVIILPTIYSDLL